LNFFFCFKVLHALDLNICIRPLFCIHQNLKILILSLTTGCRMYFGMNFRKLKIIFLRKEFSRNQLGVAILFRRVFQKQNYTFQKGLFRIVFFPGKSFVGVFLTFHERFSKKCCIMFWKIFKYHIFKIQKNM